GARIVGVERRRKQRLVGRREAARYGRKTSSHGHHAPGHADTGKRQAHEAADGGAGQVGTHHHWHRPPVTSPPRPIHPDQSVTRTPPSVSGPSSTLPLMPETAPPSPC